MQNKDSSPHKKPRSGLSRFFKVLLPFFARCSLFSCSLGSTLLPCAKGCCRCMRRIAKGDALLSLPSRQPSRARQPHSPRCLFQKFHPKPPRACAMALAFAKTHLQNFQEGSGEEARGQRMLHSKLFEMRVHLRREALFR